MRSRAIKLGLAALAVCAGVVALVFWTTERGRAPRYVTVPITRGSIARVITASGTVNPVVTVQVGAFVSGNIQALYCDYNTRVRRGQTCATIDPRPYQLTLDQSAAALDTAKAQLLKDRANLRYAAVTYERNVTLLSQDSVSRDAVDNALAVRDAADAQVALDVATVQQRQAALAAARVNLGYTKISSPVDGTVVSRNVNVGQTVAASFQTPTLFLIAQDLTKMQVDTNVSESDIGRAVQGADATFTVDAYPGEQFRGRVAQVRQAPVSVQNVITYDVVIAAENADLRLKPGMTATARIVVARRENVLRAPVQAVQFKPAGAQAAPGRTMAGSRTRQLWVLADGKAQARSVNLGMDDDRFIEITGGGLRVGDPVIVSEARTTKRPARASAMRFGP